MTGLSLSLVQIFPVLSESSRVCLGTPLCCYSSPPEKHRTKIIGSKRYFPVKGTFHLKNRFFQHVKATEDKLLSTLDDDSLNLITNQLHSGEIFDTLSRGAGTSLQDSQTLTGFSSLNGGSDAVGWEFREPDIEYYEPKVLDEVIGVVVSGNSNKLDIDLGSEQLGTMLVKDLCPLDAFEPADSLWKQSEEGAALQVLPIGHTRVIDDGQERDIASRMVPLGSVLFMQVYGLTMRGKPLLSVRGPANRVAWHRVRQIYQLGEQLELQCLHWNSDGLVFKIEGLRALLPISQSLNTLSSRLVDHVGERRFVLITEVDEAKGKLLISERRAWKKMNLKLGSLVYGKVAKIHKFGVELVINGTSIRGVLHKSNISNAPVPDMSKLFSVGELVKAVVVTCPIPHKTALCTSILESIHGLILEDKERVFREAEEMAARYMSSLSGYESDDAEVMPDVDDIGEDPQFANYDWVDFE